MEPNFLGGVCPFPSIQAGEQRKPPGMADPGRLSFPFPLIPSPPSLLSYLNLSQTSLTELIQSAVSQSYMQQFGHLFHQAKQLFHHDPSADLIGGMANTERERGDRAVSLLSLSPRRPEGWTEQPTHQSGRLPPSIQHTAAFGSLDTSWKASRHRERKRKKSEERERERVRERERGGNEKKATHKSGERGRRLDGWGANRRDCS